MGYQDFDGLAHLQLWRTFLAVYESGSLSSAARIVGLTQPAVSAQLNSLERLVGERLFMRTARGVVATATADDLAARLSSPFEAISRALAGSADSAPQPPVRLGGAAELLAEVVTPALAPLIADGVRVHVVPGLPNELFDALRSGTLDVVIASERPRGRALTAEPLVDETFILTANPEIATSLPRTVEAAGASALERIPLLAYASDVPVLRRYWRQVFSTRLEREPALVFPDLRALRDAAAAGAGATVLPSYLCRRELDTGALVDLAPHVTSPTNTLHLLRRPASAGRPHVQLLVGVLDTAVREIVADGRDKGNR
ncbi:LysR family transcriptional regulator [Microbacterium sp. SSM24]|uniref:LysR family transcriptional regulator n=1 Tax=Microbacterium sp. SSM24 TaxID=2991714 RepID=UPI00222653C2|nr:LysR family transcriptional regulator [Microbacterium sp. SSM24]MCW3492703.1 LysR family transcriptional regulator [Microbacterium sp. SSM24]